MRDFTDSTRRAALRAASGQRRIDPWMLAALCGLALALLATT